MKNPATPMTRTIRTSLVRWFVACAALWVAATLLIAWQTNPELRWALLLWLPLVVAFGVLSGLALRRILGQVASLDDEQDGLKDAYDRARLDALNDGLTGLGNHRAFQEELDRQVTLARAESGTIALLYLDVDDLKQINEAQGHAAGDDILRATARIIMGTLRGSERGFRIGGDDFAIVLPDGGPDEAVGTARRILASALSGGSGTLGVAPFSLTIGVSAMPDLARDLKQLVHQAGAALYWGKRHGRTDVQLFDPTRHGIVDDGRSLPELAAAVASVSANRLLTPVYQPIHCLRTGRVLGYEGLVRPNADAGFANASALFIAAESTEHTVELDLASLDTVLTGARTLGANLYLSVNLSPRSLESDAFQPQEFLALVRQRGFDPARIVLELTEREAVEDLDRLRQAITLLRGHGMRIAADDVGAGNAGLRLLRELEFDIMKIDLSLVQAGVRDESSEAVLRALRELAQRRNQMTVAEGVETPDQLLAVIEMGFDAGQGYLLHRPGPALNAESIDLARVAFPPDPTPAGLPIDQRVRV
ncbi:MAG: bifunctional diguanylate cyclase/phosphodiesterase [Chloroflexi bacterium]|nr:bifunctional diguanylate cyclase/phosphodiesterase [Chloroflexota bacterium]